MWASVSVCEGRCAIEHGPCVVLEELAGIGTLASSQLLKQGHR